MITDAAAEVHAVAKFYAESPARVYEWLKDDYDDALEFMQLSAEAESRCHEDKRE